MKLEAVVQMPIGVVFLGPALSCLKKDILKCILQGWKVLRTSCFTDLLLLAAMPVNVNTGLGWPCLTLPIYWQVFISASSDVTLRNSGLCEVSRYTVQSQFGAHILSTKEYLCALKQQKNDGYLASLLPPCTMLFWSAGTAQKWFSSVLRDFVCFSGWTKQIICGRGKGLEIDTLPVTGFYKAKKRDSFFLLKASPGIKQWIMEKAQFLKYCYKPFYNEKMLVV